MSAEIEFIFVSLERAFLCTTMACESCDDVKRSSSSVSSSPSSLSITRAILIADFDEVKGLTLGFDGADAFTTSLVSRSGEVKVSMIRPERRRRLETRSSSLEIIEPFRFTMRLVEEEQTIDATRSTHHVMYRFYYNLYYKKLRRQNLLKRFKPSTAYFRSASGTATVAPLPATGFTTSKKLENWPWYTPQSFYPVRIGDVVHSKYQVLYKLGYRTTATIWMCHDLQSVHLFFVPETN